MSLLGFGRTLIEMRIDDRRKKFALKLKLFAVFANGSSNRVSFRTIYFNLLLGYFSFCRDVLLGRPSIVPN